MARLFLVTYTPLVASPSGRTASKALRLRPFIDGSIRREPDLEHPFPSISCLCRADKFAPRLKSGDSVAYMTKKRRFGLAYAHRRLTAILRVRHLFESHAEAAEWYRAQGLPLPSNCMVDGNPPNPVGQSHRINEFSHLPDEMFTRKWDQLYRVRAHQHGRFVGCEPVWVDLEWTAPELHDDDLCSVFGRVPGTQNPGALPINRLQPLLQRLKIAAPPSGP